jgi:hypothetical protein
MPRHHLLWQFALKGEFTQIDSTCLLPNSGNHPKFNLKTYLKVCMNNDYYKIRTLKSSHGTKCYKMRSLIKKKTNQQKKTRWQNHKQTFWSKHPWSCRSLVGKCLKPCFILFGFNRFQPNMFSKQFRFRLKTRSGSQHGFFFLLYIKGPSSFGKDFKWPIGPVLFFRPKGQINPINYRDNLLDSNLDTL